MLEYKPTQTLTEALLEARNNFLKEYGRFLTEEESIKFTKQIKKELYKNYNNL